MHTGAIKHCNGWMKSFKNYTSTLPCVNFRGEHVSCWDVIDAIQIHAYARTAARNRTGRGGGHFAAEGLTEGLPIGAPKSTNRHAEHADVMSCYNCRHGNDSDLHP